MLKSIQTPEAQHKCYHEEHSGTSFGAYNRYVQKTKSLLSDDQICDVVPDSRVRSFLALDKSNRDGTGGSKSVEGQTPRIDALCGLLCVGGQRAIRRDSLASRENTTSKLVVVSDTVVEPGYLQPLQFSCEAKSNY